MGTRTGKKVSFRVLRSLSHAKGFSVCEAWGGTPCFSQAGIVWTGAWHF